VALEGSFCLLPERESTGKKAALPDHPRYMFNKTKHVPIARLNHSVGGALKEVVGELISRISEDEDGD
jgi:hypothetical protein